MIKCSLIRALLPLYDEQAVSPETAQIIRAHLEDCPECRDYDKQIKLVAHALDDDNVRCNYHYTDVVRRIRRNSLLEYAAGALVLAVACYGARRLLSDD